MPCSFSSLLFFFAFFFSLPSLRFRPPLHYSGRLLEVDAPVRMCPPWPAPFAWARLDRARSLGGDRGLRRGVSAGLIPCGFSPLMDCFPSCPLQLPSDLCRWAAQTLLQNPRQSDGCAEPLSCFDQCVNVHSRACLHMLDRGARSETSQASGRLPDHLA